MKYVSYGTLKVLKKLVDMGATITDHVDQSGLVAAANGNCNTVPY